MARRIGGSRRKTRHKLQKKKSERGRISIRRYLQEFKVGDKVVLKIEPAYQKGMFPPRFHGRIGVIESKRGSCYIVKINDKGKEKVFISHPIHLKKV